MEEASTPDWRGGRGGLSGRLLDPGAGSDLEGSRRVSQVVREELCSYRPSSVCKSTWCILERVGDSAWIQHGSWRKAEKGAGVVVGLGQDSLRPREHLGSVPYTTGSTWSLSPSTHQSLKEFVFQ